MRVTGLISSEEFDHALEYQREVEFNSVQSMEIKVSFRSPFGERMPLQGMIVIVPQSDRIFYLVAVDRAMDDGVGKDLQTIFDSFNLLEGDS